MKQVFRLAAPLALLLGAAMPTTASAIEYNQVQADKSNIAFGYQQMGVSMDGSFRKFASQLRFDPAQPAQAKAVIDVDLSSIDTGAAESDAEVAGKAWFNTKSFPSARFESASVKALGGDRYEVAGKLTIKGKTVDVMVPARFTAQGSSGSFDGSFTIRRGDFAVGEGSWSAYDIVANDVQIKFRIVATATK